jgi:serine/threonine-protein kinase
MTTGTADFLDAKADRSLFIGLMAQRLDLVTRREMISAMRAWALDKPRPMEQILVEQGVLSSARLALLESLVRDHLRHYEDDLLRSLTSFRLSDAERRDLEGISDVDIKRTLSWFARTRLVDDPDSSILPAATTVVAHACDGPRFRPLRFHARGGLGEVYVARDEELKRDVAFKKIQDQLAHDPANRARFLLEAEVTGGLEHPGIVPVYGLGRYGDGRPYYAMRFIQGESLDDAIKQFHQAERPGREPGERALTLRGLLGRFVAVCEAVAYAHSRGVLHRDLKPRNIMVGKYGETIVLDWGLAKSVAQRAGAGDCGVAALRPSSYYSEAETRPGSVIGTPAYMSPEQAAGDLERVGFRSDVYSLGATLYALLTGRPPVRARRPDHTAGEVRSEEIIPPRQVKAGVPAALDAVCRKAMALRQEDRYATPRALADDIEHWLADEPVSAWREPLAGRLARWARRHRTLVVGVLIALAVALPASAGGIVFLNDQRRKAEKNLDETLSAIDRSYTQVAEDMLSDQPRMEKDQAEFLQLALDAYARLAKDNPGHRVRFEVARANQKLAEVRSMIEGPEAVAKDYRLAAVLFRRLAADFPSNPEYRRHLAQCESALGNLPETVVPWAVAEESRRHALALREDLVKQWSDRDGYRCDLAESYRMIGVLDRKRGEFDSAEKALQKGLRLFASPAGDYRDDPEVLRALSRLHDNMGNLLRLSHRPERYREAESESRLALKLRDWLREDRPRSPRHRLELARSHNNLGAILHQMHRFQDAVENYHDAETLQRDLAFEFPNVLTYRQELALSLLNLADADQDRNLWKTAESNYFLALPIQERLAKDYPEQPDYQWALARTHYSLALLYARRGPERAEDDVLRAESHFCEAVKLLEDLLRLQPSNLEYLEWAVKFNGGLAELLAKTNPAAAESHFREAVKLLEDLLRLQPSNLEYLERAVKLNDGLAELLVNTNPAAAAKFRTKAGNHRKQIEQDHPQK